MMETIIARLQVFSLRVQNLPLSESLFSALNIVNMVLGIVFTIVYLYQNLYAIIALFTKPKKYKKAEKLHKYAYLICAHNEEPVVGNLVESILNQDYPKELMHVFVVADNCDDKTAEVARNAGATVFERFSDEKGKGYAMDFAIKKLLSEYDNENFEALFCFDADNLVSKEYTMKMNDVFESGVKVGCGFRDSKNFSDSIISACASMMYLRENAIMHHTRTLLNVGTYVSGTGFYISYDLVKEMGGWEYKTLCEDIEFSVDLINQGIKVFSREDAIFYDEQPTTVKNSINQRRRWARGNHQCFAKYVIKRQGKHSIKTFSQTGYEMYMHISPVPIISFFWMIFYCLCAFIYYFANETPFAIALQAFKPMGSFALMVALMALLQAFVIIVKRHKTIDAPLWKQIFYGFAFVVYVALFLYHLIYTLFKKVTWVKVEHNSSKKITEMNDKS